LNGGVLAKRILVVEDEPRVQAVIKKRLESAGYDVLTASDGLEGLETARAKKPDLIVLDLILPKLDGLVVCRDLRHDPSCQHIPILMLTARAQDSDVQRGMMDGADIYMTKPFKYTRLLSNVSDLLLKADRDKAIQSELKPRGK
jgi:DNA-binding response OmpR family regulator